MAACESFGGVPHFAGIERVRAFLSGDGPAGAAAGAIGGIEIPAELCGGSLVCTAQVSDFKPADLVVVQVEVAVYELPARGGERQQ